MVPHKRPWPWPPLQKIYSIEMCRPNISMPLCRIDSTMKFVWSSMRFDGELFFSFAFSDLPWMDAASSIKLERKVTKPIPCIILYWPWAKTLELWIERAKFKVKSITDTHTHKGFTLFLDKFVSDSLLAHIVMHLSVRIDYAKLPLIILSLHLFSSIFIQKRLLTWKEYEKKTLTMYLHIHTAHRWPHITFAEHFSPLSSVPFMQRF